MGRPSKPTHLKLVAGNPGKRPLNKREPKPTKSPARAAPPHLSPPAKKIWPALIKAMPPGVFTAADVFELVAYCEAVAIHQLATERIWGGPHEIEGSTGQKKITPWIAAQNDAARLIAQLGAKLGLDPVSRQAINTDSGGQVSDEFGDLIA